MLAKGHAPNADPPAGKPADAGDRHSRGERADRLRHKARKGRRVLKWQFLYWIDANTR